MPTRETLFLLAMFCFAISLFNKGGYIFAFTAVIVIFINMRNVRITLPLLSLVLFSVFYFASNTYWHGLSIEDLVKYLIGPWTAYLTGLIYMRNSTKKDAFIKFIIILSLGMFLHGVLNWFAYFNSDLYSGYAYQRIAVDIWRNEVVSVTVTGMFYTLATGFSIGVLFSKTQSYYKIIAAIVLAVSIAISAFFANRTLFAIILIIVGVKLLSIAFSNKVSLNRKLMISFVIFAFVVVLVFLFAFNVGGFSDWFFSLKLIQRYDEAAGRLDAWISIFKDGSWIKYPFGNPNNPSRHNLWLDVYGEVGVIPFVIIVCLTLYFLRRFLVFRREMLPRNNPNDEVVLNIVQCLLLAVILNSAVEPVIVANPYFFLIILLIMGAMEGQTEIIRRSNLS